MDPKVTVNSPCDACKKIVTASGEIDVDRQGVLFARIIRDDGEPVIIRARALLVTGLNADNLIPVSALSKCRGCSVNFANSQENPGASTTLRGINGEKIIWQAQEKDGLYPAKLAPLTESEMDKWRGKFTFRPTAVPQVTLASTIDTPKTYRDAVANTAHTTGTVPAETDNDSDSDSDPDSDSEATAGETQRSTKHADGTWIENAEHADRNWVDNTRNSEKTTPNNSTRARPRHQEMTTEEIQNLRELHQRLGHASADRLAEAVRIEGIDLKISKHILSAASRKILADCPCCQQANKNSTKRKKYKVAPDLKPFNTMHFDLVPLPQVKDPPHRPLDDYVPPQRNRHILLGVDEATRYSLGFAIPTKKEEDIARAFYNIEQRVREIQIKALNTDAVFAEEAGYSWDAVRDRGKCIFRHYHGDEGNEFVSNTLAYVINMPKASALGECRQPYIVREGPFREGGAPVNTSSSADRKYENGLAERHHQTLERKAHAMLLQSGIGIKGYEHAYLHALESENLLPTTIPVPGGQERRRGVPFKEALGFPYPCETRPPHTFGALAYPKRRTLGLAKHDIPRSVGVFLGPTPYPRRQMKVTTVYNGVVTYSLAGPETKVGDRHMVTSSATDRAKILLDQGLHGSHKLDNMVFAEPDDVTVAGSGIPPQVDIPGNGDTDAGPELDVLDLTTNAGPAPGGEHDAIPETTATTVAEEAPATEIGADTVQTDTDDIPRTSEPTPNDDAEDMTHPTNSDDTEEEHPETESSPTENVLKSSPPANGEATTDTPGRVTLNEATAPDKISDEPAAEGDQSTAESPQKSPDAQPSPKTPVMMYVCSFTFKMPKSSRKGRAQAYAIRPGDGTLRKAIEDFTEKEWDVARMKEYNGLSKHKVWAPTWLPRGARTLDTKEVKKVRNDNSLKIRLTARGFMQRQNADYYETYSAVATPATIRLIVVIAASFGLELMTADVEQAYLQADMKEDIYLEIPPILRRLPEMKGANCLKLLKGLYGTKQAGRGWYEKLKRAILDAGLEESPEDPCLYYQRNSNNCIILAVCTVVDDFLGVGIEGQWETFIRRLERNGILLDKASVGKAKEFNGMRITRVGKHHYELDQESYISELEHSYGNKYSWRPKEKVNSPLGPTLDKGLNTLSPPISTIDSSKLTKEQKSDLELETDEKKRKAHQLRYMSLLGSLIWPSHMTRPDISFAVGAAGEHSQDPKTRHLMALERTLSYVLATKHKRLVFDCTTCPRKLDVIALSDSDFASDEHTRKSRSGIWIAINGCPIYWSSKKQTVIADSTTAAETIAGHSTLRQLRQTVGNLRDMAFTANYSPQFNDNAAMLKRVTNDRASEGYGAKNLSVCTKMLQEATTPEHKDMWPFHIDTDKNIADIFTKGHLSGANADEKWKTLEAQARGETRDKKWISDLIEATRPKPDHRGKPVLAMERAQPITDINEYKRLSSWGTVYTQQFPQTARCPLPLQSKLSPSSVLEQQRETSAAKALIAAMGLPTGTDGLIHLNRPMNILEVFCGPNKSASNAIKQVVSNKEMLNTITVDIQESCNPTLCLDVLSWNPTSALRGRIDFAWFSPPCPEYSKAKTTGVRDLESADKTAKAVLRLIDQIQPNEWVLENPTGLLRHRPFMKKLAEFLQPTSYCMFDDYDYRKETDIYTNIPCPLPHCRLTPCRNKQLTGKHPSTAQRGPSANGTKGNTLADLHRVPYGLVQKLFLFAHRQGDNMPQDTTAHPSFTHV